MTTGTTLDEKSTGQPAANNSIQVFSVGYLFNKAYQASVQQNHLEVDPILETNQALSHFISDKISKTQTTAPIFISSATAQSPFLENRASLNCHTGLFSDALATFSQAIANQLHQHVILDSFLLSDLFQDKSKTPGDNSKLFLLYTQMQRMAQNTQQEIDFWFFHENEHALKALNIFFTRYPELKPFNVKLQLASYNNNTPPIVHYTLPTSADKLQVADFNYRHNSAKLYELYEKEFLPKLNVVIPLSTEHQQATLQTSFMTHYFAFTADSPEEDLDNKIKRTNSLINDFNAYKLSNTRNKPDTCCSEQVVLKPKDPKSNIEVAKSLLNTYLTHRLSDKRGDYFSLFGKWQGMTRNVKTTTVKKLLQLLNGEKDIYFTPLELQAARDGRLSKLFSRIESLHENNVPVFASFQKQEYKATVAVRHTRIKL